MTFIVQNILALQPCSLTTFFKEVFPSVTTLLMCMHITSDIIKLHVYESINSLVLQGNSI